MTQPTRLLRRPEVRARVGLGDSAIDELESSGQFPRRVRISSRAVGWVAAEIDAFIEQRVAARDTAARNARKAG